MTFFFDNCLPPQIVAALKALGVDVVHLRDELPQKTDDEVWIPHAAQRNYICVTDDHYIRRRPAEREVRRKHGLRSVFLPAGLPRCPLWDQATKVISWWPKIEDWGSRARAGDCILVSIHGRIEPWKGA